MCARGIGQKQRRKQQHVNALLQFRISQKTLDHVIIIPHISPLTTLRCVHDLLLVHASVYWMMYVDALDTQTLTRRHSSFEVKSSTFAASTRGTWKNVCGVSLTISLLLRLTQRTTPSYDVWCMLYQIPDGDSRCDVVRSLSFHDIREKDCALQRN